MKDTVQEIVFPRIISEDTLLRSPFDINSRIFEKNTHFNFTEKRGVSQSFAFSGISLSYYFFTTYFKFNKKCI